jgi:GTP-binding protein EngB required for normal cell division
VPERVRLHWLRSWSIISTSASRWSGLVLIVDSRRGLGEQDAAMLEWVLARDRQAHVLLTKADKLNRRDSQRVLQGNQGTACADTAVTAQLVLRACEAGLRGGARGHGPVARIAA